MRIICLLLLPLMLLIASCTCSENMHCSLISGSICLTGYSSDEADTVVIKRYMAGNNFTQLKDSLVLRPYTLQADTLSTGQMLEETYDYDISLPHAGRNYRIDQIRTDGHAYQNVKQSCFYKKLQICTYSLVSYRLSDTIVYLPANNSSDIRGGNFYLSK